jgi:hypothetical protein
VKPQSRAFTDFSLDPRDRRVPAREVLSIGQDVPDGRSPGANVHLDAADEPENVTDECDCRLAMRFLIYDW